MVGLTRVGQYGRGYDPSRGYYATLAGGWASHRFTSDGPPPIVRYHIGMRLCSSSRRAKHSTGTSLSALEQQSSPSRLRWHMQPQRSKVCVCILYVLTFRSNKDLVELFSKHLRPSVSVHGIMAPANLFIWWYVRHRFSD